MKYLMKFTKQLNNLKILNLECIFNIIFSKFNK